MAASTFSEMEQTTAYIVDMAMQDLLQKAIAAAPGQALPIVAGVLAATVRFHIEQTAAPGQEVFARDVMGAFIGPIQAVADQVLKERQAMAEGAKPS